jgi:uncharacterized membrane protein YkvI
MIIAMKNKMMKEVNSMMGTSTRSMMVTMVLMMRRFYLFKQMEKIVTPQIMPQQI